MTGRYTGAAHWFLSGPVWLADQYKPLARKLAAYIDAQASLLRDPMWKGIKRVQLSDGAVIIAERVGDLQYNFHIDVTQVVVSALNPILRILQYQFVYTGGAGKPWDLDISDLLDGVPIAGGSAVGVVFIVRENRVDHVAIPLVSTLVQPENGEWVFVDDMSTTQGFNAWVNSLLIPRHESGLLPSQHLQQPDEHNIVHSAWMPKGNRHYLAEPFTVASAREIGTLNGFLSNGFPRPPSPVGRQGWVFETGIKVNAVATDVGYEAELNAYQEPTGSVADFQAGPKKGTTERSAPDSDWYTSYGVQEAATPDGLLRKYGVFIDASQTVYVWPLDAAGTGAPNPAYTAQAIKTNVDPFYVQSHNLVFPAEVFVGTPSFRDSIGPNFDPYQYGPLRDATRYAWSARHDGAKYCTVVERLRSPLRPVSLAQNPQELAAAPDYYFWENEPHRISNPAAATVDIVVTPYGEDLHEFTIAVSPVQVVETDLFPIQARFATDVSFAGTERGDLLIGGFRVRRLDDAIDEWDATQGLTAGDTLYAAAGKQTTRAFFNCNAMITNLLPVNFGVHNYADAQNGSDGINTANFYYNRIQPPYAMQDMFFYRNGFVEELVGVGPELTLLSETTQYRKSFVLEGEFVVQQEARGEVFSVCCRKFRPNEFDFGNFFTAQISSLDISTGSMVLGLCESTTWVSGVVYPAVRYPSGILSDYSGKTGVNTTQKGFAIYKAGVRVQASDVALAAGLDLTLTTPVVPKDLEFWGTLRTNGVTKIPPEDVPEDELLIYAVNGRNLNYFIDLFDSGVIQLSELSSLVVGFKDFPWGLEMYSWFCRNHFSEAAGFQTGAHLAGEDIVAYTGTYLDIETPVEVDCETHDLVNNPAVSIKHIDVLNVGGTSFLHSDLYEEAFGTPAILNYHVNVQSIPRHEGVQGGYPHLMRAPQSDRNNWMIIPIFSPFAVVTLDDGTEVHGFNLITPEARMYCNTANARGSLDFPYINDDPSNWFRARGAVESPFRGAAYSLVNIEE